MSSFAVVSIALCVCLALVQRTPVDAANILAVQSIAGESHWNVMLAVLWALTDRGHSVTVFTPFADGDRPGYTEVDVSEEAVMFLAMDATFLMENFGSMRKTIPSMLDYTITSCNIIYGHRLMADILNGKAAAPKFDLVVTEPLVSECAGYAATVLRVPTVYVVSFPIVTYLERPLTGHVPNPTSAGHVLSVLGFPKTFTERFANVALTV